MPTSKQKPIFWWGCFDVAVGQTGRWDVGPFSLSITHMQAEWQVQYREADNDDEILNDWKVHNPGEPLDAGANVARFLSGRASSGVELRPALADRALVVRPVNPLYLPTDERVNLFVSSPLWITASVAQGNVQLLDVPIQRPSDTWFGPSTWEGDLCYAARTRARLNLEALPPRPHRAITGVRIHNKGKQTMLLERLTLPMTHLTLYSDADGMLWTNDLRIAVEDRPSIAELRIKKGNPLGNMALKRVADPRDAVEDHVLQRALHAIFG